MRRWCSALIAAALAACGGGPHAPRAKPAQLVEVARVDHVDLLAREAAIAALPGGRLFVAGYGMEPHPKLWQSDDHGSTWTRVDVGGEADGAIGNSDVDLATGADGTLYFVNLLYDREASEGRQITVGASRDGGATWTWTTLSAQRWDDRPWVAVTRDGTAHVIWSNEAGVHHAASKDRGTTWTAMPDVAPHGNSSHLAAGPRGELAARITPVYGGGRKIAPGVDHVAISTDGGDTWTLTRAPGERAWVLLTDNDLAHTPRWVEPLAWDPRGALYSLWTAKDGIHLARSRDQAKTWTDTVIAHPTNTAFFPYLIATGPGQLAATWFTASSDDLSDLRWQLAKIDGAAVTLSAPYTLEAVNHHEAADPRLYNDTGGEYLMPIALGGTQLAVVGALQNKPAERLGFTLWTFELR